MILALSEYLAEEGNEDLQREFHHKLIFGGRVNPKTFLELLNSESRKDKSDIQSRLATVWASLCAGVAITALRT